VPNRRETAAIHACRALAGEPAQDLHLVVIGASRAKARSMPAMLVTCPESAHLERIELEVHPLGILIKRCTAFEGRCIDCPRTCAARLDRRLASGNPLNGAVLLLRSCLR
jgi:hypothetical protein